MTFTSERQAEVEAYTLKVQAAMKETVQPLLQEAMDPDNVSTFLQPLYEELARALGIADGYAAMAGIPRELRLDTMRHAIHRGKHLVLASHNADCPGCEASALLQSELEAQQ